MEKNAAEMKFAADSGKFVILLTSCDNEYSKI